MDNSSLADTLHQENVDFVAPEGAPGQDAANFSMAAQREQFLGGGKPEVKPTPEPSISPSPQIPETEQRKNGVRKTVEVNGRKWEYLEYGNPDGKPLLNVHGWLGSSAEGQDRLSRAFAGEVVDSPGMQHLSEYRDPEHPEKDYRQVADNIAEEVKGMNGKYHIISPELPGFGKTEALDNVSLDAMADELAAFQKETGMESSVVFGSSMGGILATKLAARHPEEVRAIVLQGTMTQPDDMNRIPYIAAQFATLKPVAAFLNRLGISKNLFASIVKGSKDFKIADEQTQQRIISDTLSADARTASVTLREIGRNIEQDIQKVQCPVVVVDGANGDLVPILNSARAAARFHPETPEKDLVAEKKVVFLPIGGRAGEQGHNIVNTAPEFVAGTVSSVLDKVAS